MFLRVGTVDLAPPVLCIGFEPREKFTRIFAQKMRKITIVNYVKKSSKLCCQIGRISRGVEPRGKPAVFFDQIYFLRVSIFL